ncbi:MAG: ISAzo13 family transposase [candidate division NC10 bacterium]
MKDDTAGDPISGIKWARKAAGKISLRRARNRFERQGLPIISVDTKKREMIGLFKNPGAKWAKAAIPVNDHDFRKDAVGVAISYGIYDPQANRGHVVVGTSRNTSQFAGDALALWWKREGHNRYPDADRLLVLADCGGSNGNRVAAWKFALQHKLCDAFGLRVTVAHYPPGASKWNPIEHRLFSQISKHWAGQPLVSFDTIVRLIRQTKTKTGLRVNCRLVKRDFPTAQKISNAQMRLLPLLPHPVLPAWNYTLAPRQTRK